MSKPRAWTLRLIALAWLAIFMMAVAPTVAGLVRPAAQGVLLEVCTPLGIQFVPADPADGSPAPAPDGRVAGLCPLCISHAVFALPSALADTLAVLRHDRVLRVAWVQFAARPGRLAASAHSARAPPRRP
jgi:hypothetical protein